MRRAHAFVIFTLVALAACVDKAKADWDRCVERDKAYDVAGAYSACAAAAAADPKSPSGQAAAQKLGGLQLMVDKMKSEQADKVARDDAIKRASELDAATTSMLLTGATATTSASAMAPPASSVDAAQSAAVLKKVHALALKGDGAGARALLEPRVMSGVAAPEEISMLLGLCKAQHDKACVKKVGALAKP